MDRRRFLLTSLAGALAAPLAAGAQQVAKMPIVGAFSVPSMYFAAFSEGLRAYGYVPGRNLIIEQRGSGVSEDRRAEGLAELVRLNVAVIVTGPNTFIDQARRATSTIPIVMVYGADPIGRGYAATLARPGGNITGLSWDVAPQVFGKYIELLTELSPRPSRIAGLVDPRYRHERDWEEAASAAAGHAVTLQYVEVVASANVPKAFDAIVDKRANAVLVFGGPYLWSYRDQIINLALHKRLPTMFMYREGPDSGGLMSYGPNLRESWRLAARYVDRILKGAKPADLPIEQPTKFELVINLKTAKALGLTIPPSLLARADQVIE
jgi:putative ABC transport system substrate-binding protein